MRTKHLEYLLDLQKTLSLTKTAENYFTSHQVINNAIKSLEDELHIHILNRSPKGVTFTEAGLLVCDYAFEVLNRKNQLLTSLDPYIISDKKTLKGELDLYVIPRFSNKQFLNFYTNFSKKNKYISTSIKTLSTQTFYSLLPIEKPFIFLVTLHSDMISSEDFKNKLQTYNLSYEHVCVQKLGYCISKQSKWLDTVNSMDEISINQKVPFAVFNFSIDEHSLLTSDYSTNFYTIDNFESQKELIKNGDYVGICTPWEFKKFFQAKNSNLTYIPNSVSKSHFYYSVIYNTSYASDPIILNMIDALKKFFY